MKNFIRFLVKIRFYVLSAIVFFSAYEHLFSQPFKKTNQIVISINKQVAKKKYSKAEKILTTHIAKCPKSEDLLILLSSLQYLMDSTINAIKTIEKGLIEIPGSHKLLDHKAIILMNFINDKKTNNRDLIELYCDELINLKKILTKEKLYCTPPSFVHAYTHLPAS